MKCGLKAATFGVALLAGGCGGDAPAPPAEIMREVKAALPIDPSQLADLKSALGELQSLVQTVQTASPQGRARMVQQKLTRFLNAMDAERPLPFRANLDRIVGILAESNDGQLTDSQRSQLRQEIQSILKELGIDTSGSSDDSGFPPPPGPGGPPRGPGPGPGPPRPPGR